MKTQSFLGRLTVSLAALSLIVFSSTASARKHLKSESEIGCTDLQMVERSRCTTKKVKFQKSGKLSFTAEIRRLVKSRGDQQGNYNLAGGAIRLFRNGKSVRKWKITPSKGVLEVSFKVKKAGKYHLVIQGHKYDSDTSVHVEANFTGLSK